MGEQTDPRVVAWAVAGALAAFALVRLLSGCGDPGPQPVSIAAPGAAPAQRRDATIYVHVAGEVRRPGLLRVATGARVAVALERAGGPTRRADLTAINLAEKLADGRQIVVPRAGAAAAGGGAVPGVIADGAGAVAKPSLATATVDQLDALDGIGPTLAGRIVEERDRRGGFRSIDQLAEVDGIGDKRLEALREALSP